MASSALAFTSSEMSEDQAYTIWSNLRLGLVQIQTGHASNLRYEELYRNAYTLVLHKHGALLHDGVVRTIQERLDAIAEARIDSASDEQLVCVLVSEWDNHKLTMTMIRDVLMYMDKTFCEREGRPLIFQTGVRLFSSTIIARASCQSRLQSILLRYVQSERRNESIDQSLVKHCLSMLVECSTGSGPTKDANHDLYVQLFENAFLDETRQFYRQESAEFIAQNSVPDYLRKIEQRLNEEDARADHYLYSETKARLRSVCHDELVAQYAQQLVENANSGCQVMFQHNEIENLHRIYTLFKRCPETLIYVSDAMKTVVRVSGEELVHDQDNVTDPHRFVQSCLDLRSKFVTIVRQSFDSDRTFAKCLKEAFEHFINLDSRAAHYLASYTDHMMKKGLRGCSDDEIESKLDDIITIFRYILDKDVFEEFYKIYLSQRLLANAHISDDVERSMIAKLKAECGHQFTSKLEGMFKNIELSKELNQGYQQLSIPHQYKQIAVNVLTSGFWPFSESPKCNLPSCIVTSCDLFTAYYSSKHAGHKIFWQTSLGSADLNVRFALGRKELVVHTYQMCILMLFNAADSLTFADIQNATGIPPNEMQRHLLSLAHPKVRILLKNPNTKQIASDHVFTFNTMYTSNLFRIKVPLLQASSSDSKGSGPGSDRDVSKAINEARNNRIDAAIVRILKARRTIEHSLLVAEVSKQLQTRFNAEPIQIKRRIESLIERDYLERDKDDRRLYHYLA